jgi:hypothetical protein
MALGGAGRLGYFLHPAGVDAVGADENPPYLAVNSGFNPLQVGSPESFSLIVGVADAVSYRVTLAADFADSRHD